MYMCRSLPVAQPVLSRTVIMLMILHAVQLSMISCPVNALLRMEKYGHVCMDLHSRMWQICCFIKLCVLHSATSQQTLSYTPNPKSVSYKEAKAAVGKSKGTDSVGTSPCLSRHFPTTHWALPNDCRALRWDGWCRGRPSSGLARRWL